MYDIHCHIIPNVDDGSGSFNDSIEMAQLAYNAGTKGIIATPHCNMPDMFENYWDSKLEEKTEALQNALKNRGISITIYPGQEIFLGTDFLEFLKKGELITLNHSRYALVEFDFHETEQNAYKKLECLVANGYVPIVAHPERYGFVIEDSSSINRIRSLGALLQVNGGSLNGHFGFHPARVSREILENEQAAFVASDAHSQYSRTPNLADAYERICEYRSYDYADLLLELNPLKVIDNKGI